jgi:hypothetical protein
MCFGSKAPSPPPPPAPPPAQAPTVANTVDFDAVDTDSAKLRNKKRGKGGLRIDRTQNSLGTPMSAAGSGLTIPTSGGN